MITGGSDTDGYNNHPAGNLKFGFGRGEILTGSKIKPLHDEDGNIILYKDGKTVFSCFINHKGLHDEGPLEMVVNQGIVSLRSSDNNLYEYPIFLEYQIEYSLERGEGTLTWPDKEGRPYGEIDLDVLLSLNETKIDKDLTNAGMDDKNINEILELIRQYKKDIEGTRDYLRRLREDRELEELCASYKK